MATKKPDLHSIILRILKYKDQTNIHEIAENAGLEIEKSAHRRAIQRVLADLIKNQQIETQGQARARVYVLKYISNKISEPTTHLLQPITKPIYSRKSISYNPNFLKSYTPNKTFYLNKSVREELFLAGQTGNIVQPQGTYARTILNRLLIDLSWNSSRLEGNTYSLLETKRLIELGESAAGKDAIETQMILNHKESIEYLVGLSNDPLIKSHEICSIHALLSENLLGDPSACGRLRSIPVGISGSSYIPLDNPHSLKEFFDTFIEKFNQIKDPFEQSFFALGHLSYLQAFEDVNKRTSRLLSNLPLIKHNLKPLSFVDVSQKDYAQALLVVYEKNNVTALSYFYEWSYKKSAEKYSAVQKTLGETNLFRLKHRNMIHDIVRTIVLKPVSGSQIVDVIRTLIQNLNLPEKDSTKLFQLIELEIMSLHDGNIARFKVTPNEFQQWREVQHNK